MNNMPGSTWASVSERCAAKPASSPAAGLLALLSVPGENRTTVRRVAAARPISARNTTAVHNACTIHLLGVTGSLSLQFVYARRIDFVSCFGRPSRGTGYGDGALLFRHADILLKRPRSRESYPLTRIGPSSSNQADCKRMIFGVRSPQPHPSDSLNQSSREAGPISEAAG